jgi:hypothetical protein
MKSICRSAMAISQGQVDSLQGRQSGLAMVGGGSLEIFQPQRNAAQRNNFVQLSKKMDDPWDKTSN